MYDNLVPKNFDEFVLHKNIVEGLKQFTKDNMINTLFYGQNNCGKTTLIMLSLNIFMG